MLSVVVVVVAVVFKPLLPQFSVEVSRFVCFDIFSFKKIKCSWQMVLTWSGRVYSLVFVSESDLFTKTNNQNLILH